MGVSPEGVIAVARELGAEDVQEILIKSSALSFELRKLQEAKKEDQRQPGQTAWPTPQ